MKVEERLRVISMIDKIKNHDAYAEKIGVKDVSKYHGFLVDDKKCSIRDAAKDKLVPSKT